jgi:hypothetical protein
MPLTHKAFLKSLAGLAAAAGRLGLDMAPGFWERIRKAR